MTDEDPEQLADRMREAVATIVGKQALEEFRVKTLPLERPEREGRSASRRVTERHCGAPGARLRSRAMLFRRKLPRSSFVLLLVIRRERAGGGARDAGLRAPARRGAPGRRSPDRGRRGRRARRREAAVLTETVLEVVTLPSRFAPPGAMRDLARATGRIVIADIAAGEVVTAAPSGRVRARVRPPRSSAPACGRCRYRSRRRSACGPVTWST